MLGIGVFVASHAPGSGTILPQTKILGEFKDRIYQDGGIAESYSCAESSLLPLLLDPGTFTTGLLESYPGAAAAYSLRQLRRSVSPYAIRVRRSSDDTELDIGFTSNGDLDLGALLDFAGDSDACVSKWYDQSSNGNDATQSSPSAQPKIVSSGSLITENGKPAVDFDGSDEYLDGANKTTIDNTAIFSVIKSDSNTQDCVFIQTTVTAGNQVTLGLGGVGSNNAIGSRLVVGGTAVSQVGDSTFTSTDQILVSYLADNATGQMFIDGTQETDAVGSRNNNPTTTIGARGDGLSNFNGKMQEVIFYDSVN